MPLTCLNLIVKSALPLTDLQSHLEIEHGFLTYDDMHPIRLQLTDFMKQHKIADTYIANILLAPTEILTNLIKHPPTKADHVSISLAIDSKKITLDIADNSTAFADYDAKCESALDKINIFVNQSEGCYGLGCLITLFKNMSYTPMYASEDVLNHFRLFQQLEGQTAHRKHIFLVDDDPVSLLIHKRMLEDDYNVVTFDNAKAALEAFSEFIPELIISDLQMPEMDGIELRKALAELPNGNLTPFVFLSAYTENENNPYISSLGVDDFISKPVSKDKLMNVTARLIYRSQQIHQSINKDFSSEITDILKPSLPNSYKNWNIYTHHKGAEAGGGDFILHDQSQSCLTVILADVMGHGKQAKFYAHLYAGYLRGLFRLYAGVLGTAQFLKNMSDSIQGDDILDNMMMTCQCFQLYADGTFKISSAGHPPPLIVRKNNIGIIDVKGPLFGLLGEHTYSTESVTLQKGDKIILMTDGFMQSFSIRGYSNYEIATFIQKTVSADSPLASNLWDEYLTKTKKSTKIKDDATLIVLEFGGIS